MALRAPAIEKADAKPVPKVIAAGAGGAAATLIIVLAKRLANIDIPPDVAAGIVAVVAFVAGYFTKGKK